MATVYLAEDMRHRRQVAVKVLRPELAATLGADRFTREIETVAQFQHPHILPLLDSGQADGFFYYVMPSVEGESLRDRLARHGELPIHDAVKILVEVVDALAYAHAHGVVHRDIKPDNVLLSGRHALVMDFGVAKALSDASAGSRVTTAGVALGTPAYMAPEQAAADPHIDHRADLYAVGVLGYELVTGGPPFVGKTASEVLAAQVTRRPEPLQARRPACPAALAHIVMKCLEKRPADRWQSADELLAQLEPLATPSGGTTPTATRPMAAVIGTPLRRYVAAAVVLAAVVVGVVLLARPRPPAVALGRRVQVTLDPGLEIDPALSPDGKLIAYTAGSPGRMRLYVRQLEGGTPVPVVRGVGGFQRLPHWAPDGARLLFLSDRGIEIAPALGGAPRLLLALAGAAPGPISPDGRSFLYASGDSLYLRPLDGALARLIVTGLELHSFAWSPDGRWIAYVSGNKTFIADGTFGNLAPSSVWIVRATGGAPHRATDDRNLNMSPVWMPEGRALLYVSNRDGGRDVYAVTVAASGASAGPPVRLTTGLNVHGISVGASGGLLAYSAFTETSNVWSLPIPSHAPLSVAQARPVTSGNQTIEGFDVSPDGRWLAFDSNRNGVQQVFRVSLAGGEPAQLTNDSTDVFFPAYSDLETSNVWSLPIPSHAPLSVAQARPVTSGNQTIEGFDVSPDGRWLAFDSNRNGVQQVFRVSLAGGEPAQLTNDSTDVFFPAYSPDGREIAFHGFRAGRRQVFVIGAAGGPATQVSRVAGDERAVAWDPGGRRLATQRDFDGPDPRLDIVTRDVQSGWSELRSFSLTVPRGGRPLRCQPRAPLAWSPDGRWIAVSCI